ncbi:MAG: hypothetical protein BWY15_01447 [Firmicutes bacterium ADurb.Bin193]|nr:MAG: hypothetical protein BWY15_01447 [Firmicutes bacterium ADurb.Bin193]
MKTKTLARLTSMVLCTVMVISICAFEVAAVTVPENIEWRPITDRREGEFGNDLANFPRLYANGMYGGDGYEYIQGAAVGIDGTVLMGQDMGSARVSLDFGKSWFTPPNLGNPIHIATSCAIDPSDPNVMFIAMTGSDAIAGVGNHEGIYRSTDKGQSWTLVKNIRYMTDERFYHANFACYPTTGGSSDTRTWRYVCANESTGTGKIYTSANGGVTWDDGINMSDATFGADRYCLVQHPTNINTLYVGTVNGLYRTTNGGTSWTEPWSASLDGEVRSFWIDPDNTSHFLATVTSNTAAKRGLWETTNGGTNWTRILSDINPSNFAVGAKNASGQRMIYVHNKDGNTPRIRKFNGTWLSSFTLNKTDPNQWGQGAISGQNQAVFLPHPTIPDACIAHGRAFWWRSEGSQGAIWDVSSNNYHGPEFHDISFDKDDWKKMDIAIQDGGTLYTDNGTNWFSQGDIAQAQWDAMKALYPDDCRKCSTRAIARIPSAPWPTGMPAPANGNVPGRRIISIGGTTHHFILYQNAGSSTWVDRINQNVNVGGDGIRREFVNYSRQNYNIVYAGPNVSTDGGTTWTAMTASQNPVMAMSYLNGDIVYTVTTSGDTYTVKKSTNRGASWLGTNVYSHTSSLNVADIRYKVWVDPNSDDRVYTCNTSGDLILRKWNGSAWSTVNACNLSGEYDSLPLGFNVADVRVDFSDSKLIYALVDVAGAPTVWRGTWNAAFTSCTWEDITLNAPRVSRFTDLHLSPITGDLILGSGNGTYVFPAPESWQHSDPNMRQYKRALWNNLPRPIPGDLLFENFNEYTTNSAPPGWTVSGDVIVVADPNPKDKSMKLNDTSTTGGLSAIKTFRVQPGTVTVEYMFKVSGTKNLAGVDLRDSNGTSAVTVKTHNNAQISYNVQGVWTSLQSYSANTWYTIRIEANSETDTCSIYVDGVKRADNVPFNNSVSGISEARFSTGGSQDIQLFINNFRVTDGHIVFSDFNDESTGSAPAGWTTSGNVTISNTPDSKNKSMLINDTTASGMSATKIFTPQTGTVTAEYTFKMPTLADNAGIELQDGAGTAAVAVKTKSANLKYLNSGGTWVTLRSCSANTWYSVKIVADVAGKKFDVYVDGEKYASNVTFSNSVDSISAIKFVTGSAQTQPLYVDNVMFTALTDTTPVESPTPIPTPTPTPTQGSEALLIDDNFNSDTIGNAPSGYTVSGAVTVAGVPSDSDRSMLFDDSVPESLSATKLIEEQTEKMTIEYDCMAPATVDFAGLQLEDPSGTTGVMVKFKANGNIAYKNSAGVWTNLAPYSPNTWYHIKIEADSSTDTCTISIDGTPLATNVAYNAAVDSISQIHFLTGTSYTGNMYIDNVKVWGKYLINDNLNSETTGSAPAGYTISGNVTVAEIPSANNKSIKFLDQDASNGLSALKIHTALVGEMVLEFDMMLPAAMDFGGVELGDGTTTAIIIKTRGGQVISYKDSNNNWINMTNYTTDTWHHIKIEVDVSANTCTVYIDGSPGVTDVAFNAPVESISHTKFVTGGSYQGTLYIDNIKCYIP